MYEINGYMYAGRFRIHPTFSCEYNRCITATRYHGKRPESNVAHGNISDKAYGRIMNAAGWLLFFSDEKTVYSKKKRSHFKFRLSFITLTLPVAQKHDDTYIVVHMLQPFLKWMARKHNAVNYIWKAEIQPKRYYKDKERCIHFHITTNKFIHYKSIRNKWARLCVAHGYLKEANEYVRTEIKSVIHDKEIGYYMAEYITKNPDDDDLKVTCKVWGCNHNLSTINCSTAEEDSNRWFEDVNGFLELFCTKVIKHDYCKVYYTKLKRGVQLPETIQNTLHNAYLQFNTKEQGIIKYYMTETKDSVTIEKKTVHHANKVFVEQLALL